MAVRHWARMHNYETMKPKQLHGIQPHYYLYLFFYFHGILTSVLSVFFYSDSDVIRLITLKHLTSSLKTPYCLPADSWLAVALWMTDYLSVWSYRVCKLRWGCDMSLVPPFILSLWNKLILCMWGLFLVRYERPVHLDDTHLIPLPNNPEVKSTNLSSFSKNWSRPEDELWAL